VHPVDVIVGALVLLGAVVGARRGLIAQLARLIALAGGLYAARLVSPEAAAGVRAAFRSVGPPADRFLGFLAVFFAIALAVTIAGIWLRERIRETKLAPLDRAGGALLGGVKGLLLCYVALFAALCFPLKPVARELRASWSAPALLAAIGVTAPLFPPEFEARGRAEAETIARARARPAGGGAGPGAADEVPCAVPR
jgi:uncharacterized membrane protein required for colicin V production